MRPDQPHGGAISHPALCLYSKLKQVPGLQRGRGTEESAHLAKRSRLSMLQSADGAHRAPRVWVRGPKWAIRATAVTRNQCFPIRSTEIHSWSMFLLNPRSHKNVDCLAGELIGSKNTDCGSPRTGPGNTALHACVWRLT